MSKSSLCDQCGGQCCRYVKVMVGEMTADQLRWAEMRGDARPVRPGAWAWCLPVACPHLDAAGRCGIYETRPHVCRTFEVGGELCRDARRRAGLEVKR